MRRTLMALAVILIGLLIGRLAYSDPRKICTDNAARALGADNGPNRLRAPISGSILTPAQPAAIPGLPTDRI